VNKDEYIHTPNRLHRHGYELMWSHVQKHVHSIKERQDGADNAWRRCCWRTVSHTVMYQAWDSLRNCL